MQWQHHSLWLIFITPYLHFPESDPVNAWLLPARCWRHSQAFLNVLAEPCLSPLVRVGFKAHLATVANPTSFPSVRTASPPFCVIRYFHLLQICSLADILGE